MPKTYTTISGDTWDGVAYKTMGDETYMDKIVKLNRAYQNLVILPEGLELALPELVDETAEGLPPWKELPQNE